MTCHVIIVAAGKGRRLGTKGGDKRKGLRKLGNLPLFLHSFFRFLECSFCRTITLIVHSSDLSYVSKKISNISIIGNKFYQVVKGGKSRQESVFLGLKALEKKASKDDWVMIHDAARPFLSLALLRRLWRKKKKNHGIVPGVFSADTVKKIGPKGEISKTLIRSSLRLVQTPQLFPFSTLLSLHQKFSGQESSFTDDASLFEKAGIPVILIHGEKENFKITDEFDWKMAEIWNQGKRK